MTGFKEESHAFDVVIVGGGMTGLCAALAAARHGAKTALVQDRPVLGGNASGEIRMHICGATANNQKPELCEGGILHELMLRNKRVNDGFNYSVWDAVLLDAAKRQENLTLYLNTTMHAACCEDGAVRGVTCYQMTTERTLTLSAPIFADCTGNGTLAAFAGVPFRTGSEAKAEFGEPHAPERPDADRMGNTLLFKAADTGHPVRFVPPVDAMRFTEDQLRYRKHTAVPSAETQAVTVTRRDVGAMFDGYCQDYGYWWIELCGEGADIISEYEDIRDDLVRAVYGIWDHIKNGGDHGAENYELVWVGMLPGVRESRRIEADCMLNENDVLGCRRFSDAVAYGGWQVDRHTPGGLLAFDSLPSSMWPVEGAYTIPYRSYLAKGMRNLYVGGRCFGASKLAFASARVMGTCAVGGQAIGTAAAQCAARGVDIRSADIPALQQTLLRDDCYLPGIDRADPADLARKARVSASSEQPGFEAAQVVSGPSRRLEGEQNAWRSKGLGADGAWLRLDLPEAKPVSQVQLVFDSNFDIEKKMTMSSRRQKQQKPGIPEELARDIDVELLRDGRAAARRTLRGNYLRLRRVDFEPAVCDAVRITVRSTNGTPDARLFEVRIYGPGDAGPRIPD